MDSQDFRNGIQASLLGVVQELLQGALLITSNACEQSFGTSRACNIESSGCADIFRGVCQALMPACQPMFSHPIFLAEAVPMRTPQSLVVGRHIWCGSLNSFWKAHPRTILAAWRAAKACAVHAKSCLPQ